MAHERVFVVGARLMQEGEQADHVAVILDGLTEIRVCENGVERVVAERGPGQLIGERAALEVNVRSATVVAIRTVVALVMRTADFAAFIGTYPAVLKIVENQIFTRLREGAAREGAARFGPSRHPGASEDQADGGTAAGAGGMAPWSQQLIGQNCTIVRTDVVAFADTERSDEDHRIIREDLLAMTRSALGPAWDTCRPEDRGDGLLIIVSPGIPTAQVIERLLTVLPQELKRHNRIHSDPVRIQLRVAVEVGPIEEDDLGVTGRSIIQASRMLDAPAFKQAIADRGAILGLIVSPFVYETCIVPRRGSLDPADYVPVPVQVKETCTAAWMQLTGPAGTVLPLREQLIRLRTTSSW